MIKKVLLIVGILFLLLGIAGFVGMYMFNQPRIDISEYENIREPRITEMDDQKMISMDFEGDPSEAGDVFSAIFSTFYLIDDVEVVAPRARWSFAPGSDVTDDLIGEIGMPVPQSLQELPLEAESGVSLSTWEYGTVAEILHEGSYESEPATVDRLKEFVDEQGYKIFELHEEEYLKGPGLFWSGNPDKYITIIRYQVRPK